MINLSNDWSLMSGSESNLPLKFHKNYPDGTDVIIFIKDEKNCYEVWSSAEHRTSGPNENLQSKCVDIKSAIDVAISEMAGWDKYLM